MPYPKPPCGTEAAFARHVKQREYVDEACQLAHTAVLRVERDITVAMYRRPPSEWVRFMRRTEAKK